MGVISDRSCCLHTVYRIPLCAKADRAGKVRRDKMTRALKLGLFGFLALFIWPGISQSEKEKQAAPVMAVEMPTYDFDQVKEGDIVKHDFRVLNRGNAPLEIRSVKPG